LTVQEKILCHAASFYHHHQQQQQLQGLGLLACSYLWVRPIDLSVSSVVDLFLLLPLLWW
jgi:hypothetical protein